MKNYIQIIDGVIHFVGFCDINEQIIFCLYEKGVILTSLDEFKKDSIHYYEKLNENRIVENDSLVKILEEEYGYEGKISFVKIGESYIETYIHHRKII